MNEGVNKWRNKWKHPQGRCLYSRMRIKIANLNSNAQRYLFSPMNNKQGQSMHMVCATYAPRKGAWLRAGEAQTQPQHEAPYYNLLKGSMCAGRSPGHFGIMSSLGSECCMIYYPYILIPYFWLSFSGFILLTEVSMTMEMDLAANFLIISWPHV